jgi:hypothetical protein
VNLFNALGEETPYAATKWTQESDSVISLRAGERRQISPFHLPPRLMVRRIEAEVYWPDGRPAGGVTVWGRCWRPWNNNNAEHAIKRFAKYRREADGRFTERTLEEYLVLATVFETCEFNNVNVLKFLLSKETTLEALLEMAGR